MKYIFNNHTQLQEGLCTAFIDSSYSSNLAYRPEFVSNDYTQGKKVLSTLEQELLNCDEFSMSVAFITSSGIEPLLQTLKELEKKNIPGKILTTDYLMFSEPKALEKLASLKNIELRMFCTDAETPGFHTKGYIFRKKDIYRIVIGSSNITQSAMTRNREWNTKIVSTQNGEVAQEVITEFNQLWNASQAQGYDAFIEQYRARYQIVKKQKLQARKEQIVSLEQYKLQPNKMQVKFISNVKKMFEENVNRALLISATGTGKTFASAFALREMNPKKALFLIHREQIAKQAIKSYSKVFGSSRKYALLSGNSKDLKEIKEADFLFSTMQMMAKPEIMKKFEPREYDVIVIDEVHHAGASSYQNIMNYFKPKFWLGMTASPDTTQYDIYEIFDHNIAYEIRLQQAMEEDLLCPFHYFGITDIEIDGQTFDDETGVKNFNYLVSEKRVKYIIEQANYYGYSGDRVKGLIFCSRIDEAKKLSQLFNEHGYRTEVLSGEDNENRREDVISRLTTENVENMLDYIFTVDIFSEGVDIPEINQVIMLRPTKSSVVFVQQLGRGLRKDDSKEFVVILDFIGNYMNNFMIPIALSGDRTYNKDSIRKYVMEGSRVIPGSSTIHFDEISKSRIFSSIDKMTTKKKTLAEKYQSLKNRLGKIPTVLEFYEYGEIDPILFIKYSGTYHRFVEMVDKEYKGNISEEQNRILEFVSQFIVEGKRPHELLILKNLIQQKTLFVKDIINKIYKDYGIKVLDESVKSAFDLLEGKFLNSQSDKKKYGNINLISIDRKNGGRHLSSYFLQLQEVDFYEQLNNLIELGLRRFKDIYLTNFDESGFSLYQKYSRKDVCRILNWEKDESSTIYGYRIKHGTCPIFVTYNKKEDISDSTKYDDQFINNQVFSWMTRSTGNWRKESEQIMDCAKNGLKIYLFIKKSDGEGSDFYYMGRCTPLTAQETINTNGAPIMNINLKLNQSVHDDIYDYFTS